MFFCFKTFWFTLICWRAAVCSSWVGHSMLSTQTVNSFWAAEIPRKTRRCSPSKILPEVTCENHPQAVVLPPCVNLHCKGQPAFLFSARDIPSSHNWFQKGINCVERLNQRPCLPFLISKVAPKGLRPLPLCLAAPGEKSPETCR